MEKRLVRSGHDRMIAGVAAGLGDYLNIDPTIVRLIFVLTALAGGPGVLAYIILWIVMPDELM
jgi:phage shock protein C